MSAPTPAIRSDRPEHSGRMQRRKCPRSANRMAGGNSAPAFSWFFRQCLRRSRTAPPRTVPAPESCPQEPAAPTNSAPDPSRCGTLWTTFLQGSISQNRAELKNHSKSYRSEPVAHTNLDCATQNHPHHPPPRSESTSVKRAIESTLTPLLPRGAAAPHPAKPRSARPPLGSPPVRGLLSGDN